MTRINLIKPVELTDQHLIAEIREINQLAGQFNKSLHSKTGLRKLPEEFTLNTGHVSFFYNKGEYLQKRFVELKEEAKKRGFKINTVFNNQWLLNDRLDFFNDWAPDIRDYKIILERIHERIERKPTFYRYYGNKLIKQTYDK